MYAKDERACKGMGKFETAADLMVQKQEVLKSAERAKAGWIRRSPIEVRPTAVVSRLGAYPRG
ncbi:hypothetical protein SPHV1_470029 [Novosphingobium sp. KN65.2]|nr:hypothetical protein SPHV1_470029 [Novosphingobium sp. KN65.2]